jgi:DNA-binding response OmpR family regulator
MQARVLIVDDEPDVVDLVRYHMVKAGFEVLIANNGHDALKIARSDRPDVILLDLMLPGIDGQEVCRLLKSDPATAETGVLMLTAKGGTNDRVKGLELGADDYVAKPFSPKELVLRVKALHRRVESAARKPLVEAGCFRMNKAEMEILVDGRKLDLTTTEYKMLALLLERRGRTMSRDQLLQEVWGYKNSIDTRTVDTHMRRVREKLGDQAVAIQTIRGEGYRLTVPGPEAN